MIPPYFILVTPPPPRNHPTPMLQLLWGVTGCTPRLLKTLLSPILLTPVASTLIVIMRAFSIQIVVTRLVSTPFFVMLILTASVCCNADLCTDSLCGANLRNADHHNAGHCNAKSSELLLEGISSESNNQAMETGIGDFEASKTREGSHSAHEKWSPAKLKSADAECFARPRSERN
jgi:hypothetical protein